MNKSFLKISITTVITAMMLTSCSNNTTNVNDNDGTVQNKNNNQVSENINKTDNNEKTVDPNVNIYTPITDSYIKVNDYEGSEEEPYVSYNSISAAKNQKTVSNDSFSQNVVMSGSFTDIDTNFTLFQNGEKIIFLSIMPDDKVLMWNSSYNNGDSGVVIKNDSIEIKSTGHLFNKEILHELEKPEFFQSGGDASLGFEELSDTTEGWEPIIFETKLLYKENNSFKE